MAALYDFLQRRDMYANWANNNPILPSGAIGIVSDSPENQLWLVVGDGKSHFKDLQIWKTFTDTSTVFTSVKAYGAKGNGTTDDTAAIQAAVNAVTSLGGGTVYFPQGNYILSNTINISANTTLLGSSQEATKLTETNPASLHFTGLDANFTTIKRMTLSGLGIDSEGGGGIIFRRENLENTEGVVIDSVTVRDCASGVGIGISTPVTCQLTNVLCMRLIGNAFSLYGGGTSVVVNNCYALTCTMAGFDLNQLNYSVLNACAAEGCDVGYDMTTCNNVQLNGCGTEDTIARRPNNTGIAFRVKGGVGNSLISCYSRNDTGGSVQLLGGNPIVVGFRQNGTSPSITGNADVFGATLSNNFLGSPVSMVDGTVGNSGTTSARPTSGLYAGYQYYDITLKKPIWYTGSGWADGSGAAV